MGEPNTPLAFRRRDACHLKQQAGHGKIAVEFGHGTKDSISRIADYGTCILLIVPQKKVRTLIKLLFRGTIALGAKSASKICHRYLSGKSSQKHTGLFGRTLYNSMLYMMLILSPLFSDVVCRVYNQTHYRN